MRLVAQNHLLVGGSGGDFRLRGQTRHTVLRCVGHGQRTRQSLAALRPGLLRDVRLAWLDRLNRLARLLLLGL